MHKIKRNVGRRKRSLISLISMFLILFMTGCAETAFPTLPGEKKPSNFPSPTASPMMENSSPLVSLTTPLHAATDVAINLKPTVTFTETMSASTLNASTFKLYGPDNSLISGNVSYVDRTATFQPTGNLMINTLYRAVISTGVQDLDGNAMAREFVWSFTTGPTHDTTAPQVSSSLPVQAATNVPLNFRPTLIFSEAMDPFSINRTTFVLTGPDNQPIAGGVTYIGAIATFQPAANLSANTRYTWGMSTGAKDLAGNGLAQRFVQTFTTGLTLDTQAPRVIATNPAQDVSEISLSVAPRVTFSEAMEPLTLDTTTFILKGPDNKPIAGTVTYAGETVTFNPLTNLNDDSIYTVMVTTGAKDLAGNALETPFEYRFRTVNNSSGGGGGGGGGSSVSSPTVTSRVPTQGATAVPTNSSINADFSETMKPLSITTPGTFTLTAPGDVTVPGSVTYEGVTATFTPTQALNINTVYTAKITTEALSERNRHLSSNAVWRFTTGNAIDTQAPVVSTRTPAPTATAVATNSAVNATFSEAMKPLSITSNGVFTLTGPGSVVVAGQVSYVGITATFTPNNNLAANTLYTARLSTGAQDLASNPLAADVVWTFTTGSAPDTQAPMVSSKAPVQGAAGVSTNTLVNAIFSEAMKPLTITTNSAFTLTGPGNVVVAGDVSYVGVTATFTPNNALLANTLYTAKITTAARDLANNALPANVIWTFTTGNAADTLAPFVISTVPSSVLPEPTGVCLNKVISATFSEDMQAITELAFTLENTTVPGFSIPVTGTVAYDAINRTARFTPDMNLAFSSTFTATVNTQAKDLAGNALSEPKVWVFRTGAANLCTPLVPFGALSNFAVVAGAGLTNSNSGGLTTINGDVGLSPTATCLGDGAPCGAINPKINGTLYANDPGGIAAKAKNDLTAVYNEAAGRPPGTTVNDLSGMVLPPGVYTSGSTMSVAVGGVLTLDAQGDPNAVFIFQVGSSLTVNNSAELRLIGGAKADNVIWAVAVSSTLGSNVIFKGNILAGSSNSLGVGSVIEGRLLCRTGQVTLLANTISLPIN